MASASRSISAAVLYRAKLARAVAGGATNRETAASLFLSERTIEFHLRNVYRKLELSSRAELTAVLSRATPTAV